MLREFFKQRILRALVRRLDNLRIAAMARQVARKEPQPSGAPVVFFRASMGIDDLSRNSGFHLLALWVLRLGESLAGLEKKTPAQWLIWLFY